MSVIHHGQIEEANESTNQRWEYPACRDMETMSENSEVSTDPRYVTCKNCLKILNKTNSKQIKTNRRK